MYADDVTLIYEAVDETELERMMGEDIVLLEKFYYERRLFVNTEKTKLLVFKGHRIIRPLNVLFSGNLIEQVTSFRLLGVVFDQNLKFNTQIRDMAQRINRRVSYLYRIRSVLPSAVLIEYTCVVSTRSSLIVLIYGYFIIH